MRAWLVYLGRSLVQRIGVRRPPAAFADKRIIVGITFLDNAGALIEQFQMHGRVVAASGAQGIVLMRPDGGRFVIPPSPQWLRAARPGEYRLRASGEVVIDPDYLMSATLSGTTPEAVAEIKLKVLRARLAELADGSANPLALRSLSCPMTSRIDAVIDRLRELPEAEQEMLAGEIEALLMEPASLLNTIQWREVEDEIDSDDGVRLSHADVMGRMRQKFGR